MFDTINYARTYKEQISYENQPFNAP
jgi:hypothetical protein